MPIRTTERDLVMSESNTHVLCCHMYPINLHNSSSMAKNKLANSLRTNANLHPFKLYLFPNTQEIPAKTTTLIFPTVIYFICY